MDGISFGPLVGPSSLVMVLLGASGAGLMAYRKSDLSVIPKALIYSMKGNPPEPGDAIDQLALLSEVARKEGMLAVEGKLADLSDPFLRQGMQLVVDGLDAEQVTEILSIDIAALDSRHQVSIGFFKALAGYAPTFGMVGTVVGLINMLGNLSDPSQLGIGMSMALLTTLYGVLAANLVFAPVSARLKRLNSDEMAARDVALDGILALGAGASPRVLVERLETYLPPGDRVGHAARTGKAVGAPAPAPAAVAA